jgi:hypothetical protein
MPQVNEAECNSVSCFENDESPKLVGGAQLFSATVLVAAIVKPLSSMISGYSVQTRFLSFFLLLLWIEVVRVTSEIDSSTGQDKPIVPKHMRAWKRASFPLFASICFVCYREDKREPSVSHKAKH